MKKMLRLVMIMLVSCTLAITGCTKEGKEGAAGTNGQDGNANVQSVVLTAQNTSNWTWDSGNNWRVAQWNGVYHLNQTTVDYGAVMLYQEDGQGGYVALPITFKYGNTTEMDWFTYGFERVTVVIQNQDGSDPIGNIPTPTRFKLVVIPQAARLAQPNVDLTDYWQVYDAYGLE